VFKKPHFHDRLNTNRLENHGLSSTNRAHPFPQVIKFRTLILNYLNNWGQGIKFSLTPGRDSRSKKKKTARSRRPVNAGGKQPHLHPQSKLLSTRKKRPTKLAQRWSDANATDVVDIKLKGPAENVVLVAVCWAELKQQLWTHSGRIFHTKSWLINI